MKVNTQCSIAIHIVLSIAIFSDQYKMTSTLLAQSTGNNPVIVRNIFGQLKKAGIIHVKRGSGGATLARSPEEITIWDIYSAVASEPMQNLLGIHPNPSPDFPIGCQIGDLLEEPYTAIRRATREAMIAQTLADIIVRYHESPVAQSNLLLSSTQPNA